MAYTDFNEVEKKWIKYWDDNKTFHTDPFFELSLCIRRARGIVGRADIN